MRGANFFKPFRLDLVPQITASPVYFITLSHSLSPFLFVSLSLSSSWAALWTAISRNYCLRSSLLSHFKCRQTKAFWTRICDDSSNPNCVAGPQLSLKLHETYSMLITLSCTHSIAHVFCSGCKGKNSFFSFPWQNNFSYSCIRHKFYSYSLRGTMFGSDINRNVHDCIKHKVVDQEAR